MEQFKYLDKQTADGVAQNLDALYKLFPSCFTEKEDAMGNVQRAVDWGKLRQLLGDNVADGEPEVYDFTWVGKRAAQREAMAPIRKTLRPCPEESVNWDTTQNLYIEGDNLEVLKLLQNSYMGKVKMIYIDPPYNTGNDFVYHDDFHRTQREEDEEAGVFNEEGERMVKNTESNGKFHSDWCSMIYSRLMATRSLLSDDGAIFVSIDDNEQAKLKHVMDEVYGQFNFVGQFIWKSKPQGGNDNPHIVPEHEYILMYAKNIKNLVTHGRPLNAEKYKYKDEYFDTRGGYSLGKLDLSTLGYRANLDYAILAPDGTEIYPGGVSKEEQRIRIKKNTNLTNDWQWRWSKERFISAERNGFIVIKKNNNNKWVVYAKEYQNVDRDGNVINRELKYRTVIDDITTVDGTAEMRELLGNRVFSFPKPTELIIKFIKICTSRDSVVLDFFSGSSSTAHSLMKFNAEEKTNNKFIMIQLPEETPEISEARNAGFKNICEIGKERIRRAGKKIKEEHPEAKDLDIGFRVFKCAESNYKNVTFTPSDYSQESLELFVDNIKGDRTDLDLLFDCMLRWGITLDLPMTSTKVDGCKIHNVNEGALVACFEGKVTEKVIDAICAMEPNKVVFRDSSFEEAAQKMNLFELFKQKLGWEEQEVRNNIRVI